MRYLARGCPFVVHRLLTRLAHRRLHLLIGRLGELRQQGAYQRLAPRRHLVGNLIKACLRMALSPHDQLLVHRFGCP